MWMGYFAHYGDLEHDDLGPKLKVHLSVYSTEFARFPQSKVPEPDQYHEIDFFEPRTSVDALDSALDDRAMEILVESPLVCPK
jgi:hypothetical protein